MPLVCRSQKLYGSWSANWRAKREKAHEPPKGTPNVPHIGLAPESVCLSVPQDAATHCLAGSTIYSLQGRTFSPMSTHLGRPVGTEVLRFMRQGLTYKQAQKKAHGLRLIEWRRKNYGRVRAQKQRTTLLRMGEEKRCFCSARMVQR